MIILLELIYISFELFTLVSLLFSQFLATLKSAFHASISIWKLETVGICLILNFWCVHSYLLVLSVIHA